MAMFDRYDIIDEQDMQAVGRKMKAYFKKIRESSPKDRTNEQEEEESGSPKKLSIQ